MYKTLVYDIQTIFGNDTTMNNQNNKYLERELNRVFKKGYEVQNMIKDDTTGKVIIVYKKSTSANIKEQASAVSGSIMKGLGNFSKSIQQHKKENDNSNELDNIEEAE